MTRSRRFAILEERDINKETFVEPWAEAGLMVTDSPYDPQPSLRLDNGQVAEMDGRQRADFDALDLFIADRGLNLATAEEAMATPSQQIARMLADINVPRTEVARLALGCTPAKLCEIIRHMNVLEMMMGMAKMRVRREPANEVETTVRVARFAPFNALAILIGTQTGRGGVLTQCSVEESLGLRLAMKGLTTYAETLSWVMLNSARCCIWKRAVC
jgi:propanediol dehydratase large subunit